MRHQFACRVVAGLALVVALPTSLAARDGDAAFTLRSEVLTRVPEVTLALAAVEQDPGDVAAWRTLGQALAERAAYADAVRAFERAADLDRANPDVWVDLGATYLRADQPSRAITALRRALKIEPFHAIAHYNLGLAQQAEGNLDEAWDAFEFALTIDPTLGDPTQNPAAVVNPDLPYVKLRVYLRTTGSSPALFSPTAVRADEPRDRRHHHEAAPTDGDTRH